MKAPRDFKTEAELAAAVVADLRAAGFEVYQEVEGIGGVADIVAVRAGRVRIVECKLAFGAEVFGQAWGWKPAAHELFIAAPRRGRGNGGFFLQAAATALGIGILEVFRTFEGLVKVVERADARDQNGDPTKLLASLRKEHQTYAAAGSPTGHRWTRFRESEKNLIAHVRAHPGALTRDAMKAISHHWRGKYPTSRVRVLIERGIITAVRIEESPEGTRFYPVEAAAPANPSERPKTSPPSPQTARVVRRRRRRARHHRGS